MTRHEPVVFDFRTAGTADDSVAVLKNWLVKSSNTFHESWESVSTTSVQLECTGILSRTFEQCISSIESESIGCEIEIGEDPIPTLAHVSCRDLASVIGCIIGTGAQADSEDRRLTSIEVSLCEMIFETLASSLGDSWPGREPLQVALVNLDDAPQRSRLISADALVLVIRIELTIADSKAEITWLLPRKHVDELLESITGTKSAKTSIDPRKVVESIGLDLTAILGNARMSMGELTQLKKGDVVVLEQKIDRPISLKIDDEPHYLCWPGQLGNRQGVEIAELI